MLNLSSNRIDKYVQPESLTALKVLQTPKAGAALAKWLVGFFVLFLIVMFLPWQQTIVGAGNVTALKPQDRPQTVETAIAGRIEDWRIQEGEFVKKGDTLLRLSEVKEKFFDPQLLQRLQEQVEAKEGNIEAKRDKVQALESQINALQGGLQLKMSQTRNKVDQVQLKLKSDSADWVAEKVNYVIAEQQYERQQNLFDKGLKSKTDLEEKKLKFQESQAKLTAKENKYYATKNELANAKIELNAVQAEYMDKISKARSDLNATRSELYESIGDLSKLKNEYANMRIRSENYFVVAPQSGYIIKAQKAGIGQTVKEGEALVTIMPDNPSLAVELYVKPMDVPLIEVGRKVRIEFEGWPALQFTGWPSVAVGTFGGIVSVIDYVDTKEKGGKYRLLVTPDPRDDPWPDQLRVGSGVYGWVMLDEVPIWYEIWRQLNGFPPSLEEEPTVNKVKDQLEK